MKFKTIIHILHGWMVEQEQKKKNCEESKGNKRKELMIKQ